eukprot:m.208515 g.208515  ORF g.208515 m.208515 type:complete len:69 (+) comp15455_c0_seq1:2828-3034(+)
MLENVGRSTGSPAQHFCIVSVNSGYSATIAGGTVGRISFWSAMFNRSNISMYVQTQSTGPLGLQSPKG